MIDTAPVGLGGCVFCVYARAARVETATRVVETTNGPRALCDGHAVTAPRAVTQTGRQS